MWIDESGVHVEAIINVENVGHSPATKATINPFLAIDSFNGWFSPIVKRKVIKTEGNNFGRTVFSGEKWEYRIQISVSANVIQADRTKQINDMAKVIKESGMSADIPPWVPFDPTYYIVCQVDYEFDASEIVHNTVRRFMIFMKNPSGPEGSGFQIPNVLGNVDLTNVVLLDIGDIRGD